MIEAQHYFEHKLGWERLGNGMYATVYAIPNSNKVLKIGSVGDTWPSYIYWATGKGYAGTFSPLVYSIRPMGNYYLAVMERLACTLNDVPTIARDKYYSSFMYRYLKPETAEPISEAAQKFRDDCTVSGFTEDWHSTNLMLRWDGHIVLTDPQGPRTTLSHFNLKRSSSHDGNTRDKGSQPQSA